MPTGNTAQINPRRLPLRKSYSSSSCSCCCRGHPCAQREGVRRECNAYQASQGRRAQNLHGRDAMTSKTQPSKRKLSAALVLPPSEQ